MKKVLSIVLTISLIMQPPCGAVAQVVPLPKTGLLTGIKEKFSIMRGAIKYGNSVVKTNWQCFKTAKGPNCKPDRYLAL